MASSSFSVGMTNITCELSSLVEFTLPTEGWWACALFGGSRNSDILDDHVREINRGRHLPPLDPFSFLRKRGDRLQHAGHVIANAKSFQRSTDSPILDLERAVSADGREVSRLIVLESCVPIVRQIQSVSYFLEELLLAVFSWLNDDVESYGSYPPCSSNIERAPGKCSAVLGNTVRAVQVRLQSAMLNNCCPLRWIALFV